MSPVSRRRLRLLAPALAAGLLFPVMPAGAADVHGRQDLRGQLTPDRVAAPEGREAPELATEKSRTWVKANGAQVTRIWNQPVNAKVDGTWRAIDNTLKPSGDGFAGGKAPFGVKVPGSLSQPLRLSDGGRWIELRLQGSAAAAKVSGASATYAGAGEGVDLKVTNSGGSIKEDLILASAASQSSFTYDVELSEGLSLELRKDGGADIVDKRGDVAFAIPAPIAQDAKGAIATGELATLAYEAGKLTVELSEQWLSEPGRAFPVILDPSAVPGASRDTFTDEITPTTAYPSGGDLYAGREAAGHDHNALTYFDVAAHVPAAAFIQEAELSLWPKFETASTGAKNLEAHAITAQWDASATWVKRTASANWAAAGGDIDGQVLDTEPLAAFSWKRFNLTDTVTSWLDGTATNHGIAITDGNSTVNRAVAFASSEWGDAAARPYLEVEYFPRTGAQPNYTIQSENISDRQSIGVNVAGGNLLLESDDLSVDAKGLPVSVSRYYNSLDPWGGQFGNRGRISLGNDIALYECDGLGSRCLVGPSGFRTRFKYNGTAKYVTPPNMGNLTLTRATATSGNFTLTDNETGTKWNFFDNSFSFNNQITDRHNNSLSFQAAGTNGSLSKITDANGRQYPVTTDSSGRITRIEVPSAQFAGGVVWQYGYNSAGDLTSVTDPENKVTTYTYTSGNLTKITDGRSNETIIAYDAHRRVTSITRRIDGTTTNDITTTFAYVPVDIDCNENGLPNSKVVGKTHVTDPNGNLTKYCYEQSGSVAKALNAKGHETDTKYTSVGNASSIMGFAGSGNANAETKFDFGSGAGYNLTQIDGAAGEQTKIEYPSMSGPALTDPLDEYRPTKVTDPDGKISRFQYANGNPTSISSENAAGVTHRSVQMTWTSFGALSTSKVNNELTRVTTYNYDGLGRLTSITPPNPTITPARTFTYDGLSRVKTATDGRGKTTTFNYDKLDRLISVVDNGTITQTFGFDANGNLTNRSEPGKASSFTYDKLNRRTADSVPGASNSYTWDKASNLKTLTDISGTVHYGYDPLNRTNSMDPDGPSTGEAATEWEFTDPTGGPNSAFGYVTQKLPGGGKIRSTNDLSGKLTELLVTNNANAQTLKRTYNYSTYQSTGGAEHELLDWSDEQDLASAPVTTKVYDYDETIQLTRASTYNASGTLTGRDTLTIDAYGNRTKRERFNGAGTVTRTYNYNIANQLCWHVDVVSTNGCGTPPAGATSFTYDADGNQNQLNATAALTYDDKGRLATLGGTSVTHLSSSNAELTAIGTSNYRNTLLGVGYIVVGGNISRLQRSPDDGAAVSQTRDSARRWFVTDHLGSTIALASSTGGIERKYDYTIDGEDSTVGSGPTTWIRYAGGHDIGNGLYHYGQRYYQPSTARWIQRDPLDQPDDLVNQNPYIYAGNNPINFADPSGEIPVLPLVMAGRALYTGYKAARASGALRIGGTQKEAWRVGVGHTPQRAASASSRGAHLHVGSRTVGASVYGRSNWTALYKTRGGGKATRAWNKPKPKYKGPKEGE